MTAPDWAGVCVGAILTFRAAGPLPPPKLWKGAGLGRGSEGASGCRLLTWEVGVAGLHVGGPIIIIGAAGGSPGKPTDGPRGARNRAPEESSV